MQVDLKALGITDFGQMRSRGFGRPPTPAHCELFFGGRPMTLARWPNEGEWERIAGYPEAGAAKDEHGGKSASWRTASPTAATARAGWKDTERPVGPWLLVLGLGQLLRARGLDRPRPPPDQDRCRPTASTASAKASASTSSTCSRNSTSPASGSSTARPASSTSGRPALTRCTSRAKSLAPPRSLLSLLAEPLLKLTDVSHVTFRGLTLEATRGSAVEIRGGASNRIAGCLIRNIGNYGVTIAGGTGHGVLACDIFDTGDGGVSLDGGDRQTLRPGGHFVENCHFARQGRWSKCYVPAVLMGGVGQRASHNLIHDHPHCAILFNGNDHLIEFNEIHHIALETGDVGAIYTGRDYTYRGNRIRHNFIHDTGGVGMGSMGVYMDDCVSGTEIFGNVFYKVQRAAFLGGGRDHQVINNIFVDCNYAVELDGRGLDPSPVWHSMVDQTMRQRLTEVPLALYRERYPALKTLDQYYGPPGGPAIDGAAFKGVPPENNVVARNVCVGKWLNVYWHATPEMLRLENNLTNAASSFVRPPGDPPRARDFALRRDSPAWKLGFQPIPFDKIGLYRDKLRASLPSRRASQ